MEHRRQDPGAQFFLTAASVVIVVAGLKVASELLRPFVVSLFLAIVSLPVLHWLRRRGLPMALAVLITVLLVLAILLFLLAVVGGSVASFSERAPEYWGQIQSFADQLEEALVERGFPRESVALRKLINAPAVMDFFTGTVAAIAKTVSRTTLVLLTMVFIFLEAAGFGDKLRAAFPGTTGFRRFSRILQEVQEYLVIKTLISLATGLLLGLWCAFWGLDFYALWGLLAFALNYIPNIGSILAAVPPVVLALIQGGFGQGLAIGIGFLTVNMLLGNFLEPNLMGRRLGLSPLVVLMSLAFWGWVWGPVGMLLSVPLTMVLKILFENTEDLRWLATLLGENPPPAGSLPE